MQILKVFSTIVLIVFLAACDNDNSKKPYLEFAGGGFIFNYNIAKAYYGFVARVKREIPPGTIIEARFENPSGGEPLVVTQTAQKGWREYDFQSPPVQDVRADQEYKVELRLRDPANQNILASYSKSFRSTTDQSLLPERPLTVGPTHAPSPAGKKLIEESGGD